MTRLRRRALFELLAAIMRGDRGASPPLPWASPALWEALIPCADQHKLTAALPGALQRIGVWEELPADAAVLLTALHELNLERNAGLKTQGLDVLATLERAGIRALPVKGLAYQLTGLHEDDRGMRLMVDLDVLVAGEEAQAAQNILIEAGYRPDPDPHMEEEGSHHLLPLIPDLKLHGPGTLEVHHGLSRARHNHLVPAAAVLAAAVTVEVDGRMIAVPCITDQLDHAVSHSGLQMYHIIRRRLSIRDAFDIARLWQRLKADGGSLADLRVAKHRAAAAHLGACLLLAGTPSSGLGPLAQPGRRYLSAVLRRQNIPEWAAVEPAVIHNALLLGQNPRRLAHKLIDGRRYRNLIALLRGNRRKN